MTLLGWLALKLDWPMLWSHLRQLNLAFYGAAVTALFGPISLTSIRWQLILRAQKMRLPLSAVLAYDLIAQFFNAFLPGTTGGDAARALYAIRQFPAQKTNVVASIVLDRGVGLLVLMVFGYLSLMTQHDLFNRIEALRAFSQILPGLALTALAGFATLFLWPSDRLPSSLRNLLHRTMDRGISGTLLRFLKAQRARPGLLLIIVLVSVASYLFTFLSAWFAARAMGLQISFVQMILILAILHPLVALPISVGGHGVREVVLIALLGALGAGTAEQAVAFSLLMVGVQWFWSLLGGLWFLLIGAGRYTLSPDRQAESFRA